MSDSGHRDTPRRVLVIQSARATVLDAYLAAPHQDAAVTVVGHTHSAQSGGDRVHFLGAPPGRLRWRRLGVPLRAALRRGRWSEIVLLHNQGDRSYVAIHAIVARIGPLTPFRIFFADGSERAYRSWLVFCAGRVPLVALASLAFPIVAMALLPFWIAARLRCRPTA